MNYSGIILGFAVFVIIGVFHPLVIKAEYYLGVKSWMLFCLAGIITSVASLFFADMIYSTLFGVFGFSCFWSIKEIFEQEERVKVGRFPRNPKRKYRFDKE